VSPWGPGGKITDLKKVLLKKSLSGKNRGNPKTSQCKDWSHSVSKNCHQDPTRVSMGGLKEKTTKGDPNIGLQRKPHRSDQTGVEWPLDRCPKRQKKETLQLEGIYDASNSRKLVGQA